MNILTNKQKEIAERESRILEVARSMVINEGYRGLNMDRIAAAVEYSKGTIYNHFQNKEEIVIALAIQNSSKRLELFRKAAQFKGCSRFRMMAILEACMQYVRELPDFFRFEEIIQLPSFREKTTEKRQAVVENCEIQCMSIVAGVVRDAIANEDLVLPEHLNPEAFVFGFWSLSSGAFSIMLKSPSLQHVGLEDPFSAVKSHTTALMDGHGWKPLSSEYDSEKIIQRIRAEVSSNE